MPLIGAHVSSAGGCSQAFARGLEIGAEVVQLFLSAPQRWKDPVVDARERAAFRDAAAESGLPSFAHAIYLVNLASQDEELREKSVASLRAHLGLCAELGITGLIFHVGSHRGSGFETVLPTVAELVRRILEETPGEARLLIENHAGAGGGVGASFAEVAAIIEAAGASPRLGLCLDTCHAFASGYDLRGAAGVQALANEIAGELGLERLVVIHANDSKTALGALRDRHENIGEGHIGLAGFAALMAHPAFEALPLVMEVPGVLGGGPDVENVLRLKAIRAGIEAERGERR